MIAGRMNNLMKRWITAEWMIKSENKWIRGWQNA